MWKIRYGGARIALGPLPLSLSNGISRFDEDIVVL